MKIWPWSRIKELEADRDKWLGHYMDLYKSRQLILKYLDSVEPGHHACVADQLYIFKPDGVWELVESPENGQADVADR